MANPQLNKSVDQVVSTLESNQQKQIRSLRLFIAQTIPAIPEQMKYGTSFFYPICYLTFKPEHIIVGLVYGVMLTDPDKKLVGKQQYVRHFLVPYDQPLDKGYLAMLLQESQELYDQGVKAFGVIK